VKRALLALVLSGCAATTPLPHLCEPWLVVSDVSVPDAGADVVRASIVIWEDPHLVWGGQLPMRIEGKAPGMVLVRTDWDGSHVGESLGVAVLDSSVVGSETLGTCTTLANVWVAPRVWNEPTRVQRAVLGHELGHVLGRDHTFTGIMAASTQTSEYADED
jgi:hypothetical protein